MALLTLYFFLLFVVAFPFGEASRISPILVVSVTLLDVMVGVGTVAWITSRILLKKYILSLQAKFFLLLLFVFIISLVVHIFVVPQSVFVVASLYCIRFASFGCLFFMVKNASPALKKRIEIFMLIGGSILLLSGYVQFFFYPSLKNLIYAGWDEHFYRMFGTFFDPNFFGLFLVLFLLFLLSFWQRVVGKYRLYISVILFTTFIGIILSYSRTALVSLVVGLSILYFRKVPLKTVVPWVVLLLALGVVAMSIVGRKAEGNDLLRLTSSSARIGDAKNALIIFSHNPIFGVGYNAYRYAQYTFGFMKGSSIQEDHGASGADSSVLLVLATTGIIGFVVFCLFWGVHIKLLIKNNSRLALATVVSLFIGSTFINGLFYPFLMLWLWSILGLTESNVR